MGKMRQLVLAAASPSIVSSALHEGWQESESVSSVYVCTAEFQQRTSSNEIEINMNEGAIELHTSSPEELKWKCCGGK
jgi:hypothetical protein